MEILVSFYRVCETGESCNDLGRQLRQNATVATPGMNTADLENEPRSDESNAVGFLLQRITNPALPSCDGIE